MPLNIRLRKNGMVFSKPNKTTLQRMDSEPISMFPALLEIESLPSAKGFADTRQSFSLPSATLCKKKTLSKGRFTECQALGKAWHFAKNTCAECQALGQVWLSAKTAVGDGH